MENMRTLNVTDIDILNFASASTPFGEILDQSIKVSKIAITADVEEPEIMITNFVTDDGKCYGGNSAVIVNSAALAVGMLNQRLEKNAQATLTATIRTAKSKGKKDFLYVEWSE